MILFFFEWDSKSLILNPFEGRRIIERKEKKNDFLQGGSNQISKGAFCKSLVVSKSKAFLCFYGFKREQNALVWPLGLAPNGKFTSQISTPTILKVQSKHLLWDLRVDFNFQRERKKYLLLFTSCIQMQSLWLKRAQLSGN